MQPYIQRVETAIAELQQGKMIILTDHPEREDEGDLIVPAETITPDAMNFIIRNSSGIVCLSLLQAQLKKLDLPLMMPLADNTSLRGTPFTISIDANSQHATGVSASDRVQTIQAAIADAAVPNDLVKPGHVFPLQARAGGVLERAGHTEGAVDIVSLAGFKPAAVLCELMNADGTMMRGAELKAFAVQHDLKVLSIEDIISYRLQRENLIEEATANLPLDSCEGLKVIAIKEKINGKEHLVLINENKKSDVPFVRVHSSCLTGDLFGSMRCDCNHQFNYALQKIKEEGGILIYLNQEGRGIGLFNKIKAYSLQECGLDTLEANEQLGLPVDSRQYYVAANVLRNRGIRQVKLLTNNPAKVEDLKKFGIDVERVGIPVIFDDFNKNYLLAKKNKLHHQIEAKQ